jgi:hypothetical protein
MTLTILTTPEALIEQWPGLRVLFQRVVDRAGHGEFTVHDLARLAQAQKLWIGTVQDDTTLRLAFAFEFVAYPQYLAINIVALAGHRLQESLTAVLPIFLQWSRESGVQAIEASCSPAMARLLARHGFQPIYQRLRLPLPIFVEEK